MPNIISRDITQDLIKSSQFYPIVTILGPRQSGKTTISRITFPNKPYVNLESPDERTFAQNDPNAFLARFPNGAILDEIQRVPQLLSYIQVLVDEHKQNGQFILTGSHQLELQEGITQSLAGRTGVLYLYPLNMYEIKTKHNLTLNQLLFTGGYPRIYEHNIPATQFYRDYTQTYLERDVKLITTVKDLDQFQRFLLLCAARVGSLIDYTKLSSELGISRHTAKHWLSVLKASFVITTLTPYFENFGKQIIKSSKLYFNDTGLLCYLLNIREAEQLENHPLRGEIFENFVITETVKNFTNKGEDPKLFFYRDKSQVEIDLIIPRATEILAIEIKASQTFQQNYLKPLKYLIKNTGRKINGTLIYNGKQEQAIQDISITNMNSLKKLLED